MAQMVPLIRAAAMAPFLRWMIENGRPVDRRLEVADLASLQLHDRERPISVFSAAALLREMALREGPDIGCRVVSSASFLDLATFGRVALGARTPREALTRIAAVLPYHCTHEHITLTRAAGDVTIVRELLALPFGPETLHISQQYVAALVRTLCAMAGAEEQVLSRIEIVPHPEAGLAHLGPWLGSNVVASKTHALALTIGDALLDRPFPGRARDPIDKGPASSWKPLRGDGTLASSARVLLTECFGMARPPSNAWRLRRVRALGRCSVGSKVRAQASPPCSRASGGPKRFRSSLPEGDRLAKSRLWWAMPDRPP